MSREDQIDQFIQELQKTAAIEVFITGMNGMPDFVDKGTWHFDKDDIPKIRQLVEGYFPME